MGNDRRGMTTKRKTPPPPKRKRIEPPPKTCHCGNVFYRGEKEELKNFLDKSTCSRACGFKLQAMRAKGVARVSTPEAQPYRDREYTVEEETEIGRSLLRRYIQASGGFPSDGSRCWSEPKIYRPGDPEFEAIAATVR
jgi:hypothetical protein